MKKSGLADSPFFRPSPAEIKTPALAPAPLPELRHTVTPSPQDTGVTSHSHTLTPVHRHTHKTNPERPKKKHGFVIFADQIEALKRLKLEVWRSTGEEPEIATFVREALDAFLAKKQQEQRETSV